MPVQLSESRPARNTIDWANQTAKHHRGDRMRRRKFVMLLGGAAVLLPITARAQQNDRIKRIGVLLGATTEHDPESEARVAAFRVGLEELGWFEGRNLRIDYRFAGGDAGHIRSYVAELVRSAPDLIVANSSPVIAELKR